jgi:hypothetical protein
MSRYTIVSAFYLIPSLKRNPDSYVQWIKNFSKLKMNCILFTNLDTFEWLKKQIGVGIVNYRSNIRIEFMEYQDFKSIKYDWNKQIEMDDEKNIHHTDLYKVWNEKMNFLSVASKINYFSTEWFIWIDSGSMRVSKVFEQSDFTYSKSLNLLDKNYCYFFQIKNEKHHNRYFLQNLSKYFSSNIDLRIIQGGCIISHSDNINLLNDKYFSTLDHLYNNGLFIGKEQVNYHPFIINNNDFIKIIQVKNHKIERIYPDVWFFYFPFLLGISEFEYINLKG